MNKLKLLVPLIVVMSTGCTTLKEHGYVKAGLGYKFAEQPLVHTVDATGAQNYNHPVSFRGEVGLQYENWSFGWSHHSQPLQGAPFNDKGEYYKDEIFVDYIWKFSNNK